MYLKQKFFVKFLLGQKYNSPYNLSLYVVYISSMSLDLQNMYNFFKTFFVRTFYHAVCNIFNIRD